MKPKKYKSLLLGFFCIFFCVLFLGAWRKPRINPSNYPVSIDYGILTQKQRKVFDDILAACKNGQDVINQDITQEEFDEVISYIGLYYGTSIAHCNVALWRKGFVLVNVELIQTLEQRKHILDNRINIIVASMYNGTDKFKLWQICNYIAKTIDYSYSLDDIEPLSGLDGKGSCITYSMLFYKMATRLGIQTYICHGDADNGKMSAPHAWNMVIIDGKQYFYDVTWYDNIMPDLRYIHSKNAWGRNYTVNHKEIY